MRKQKLSKSLSLFRCMKRCLRTILCATMLYFLQVPVYAYEIIPNSVEIKVSDVSINVCDSVEVFVRFKYKFHYPEIENNNNPAINIPMHVYFDSFGSDHPPRLTKTLTVHGFGQPTGAHEHQTDWISMGKIHPYPEDDSWTGNPDYYAEVGGEKSGQVQVNDDGQSGSQSGTASLPSSYPDIARVSPFLFSPGSNGNTLLFRFDAQSASPIGQSIIGIQQLSLTVPNGWDIPQNITGVPGYTVVNTTGTIGPPIFSGSQVLVPVFALGPNDYIEVEYGSGGGSSGVTTPAANGNYDFGISAVSPLGVQNGFLRVTVQVAPPTVNVKALIQGYYIGGGQMTPVLFNQLYALYPGEISDSLVDVVTVELHDVSDFSIIVDSYRAVINTNGNVTGRMTVASIGTSYFLAIRHRSALLTCSATPVLLSFVTNFDFTFSETNK